MPLLALLQTLVSVLGGCELQETTFLRVMHIERVLGNRTNAVLFPPQGPGGGAQSTATFLGSNQHG
jgi:hypothetical protein